MEGLGLSERICSCNEDCHRKPEGYPNAKHCPPLDMALPLADIQGAIDSLNLRLNDHRATTICDKLSSRKASHQQRPRTLAKNVSNESDQQGDYQIHWDTTTLDRDENGELRAAKGKETLAGDA